MLLWSKRRGIGWAAHVLRKKRARRANLARLAAIDVPRRPQTLYARPKDAPAGGKLDDHPGDGGPVTKPGR